MQVSEAEVRKQILVVEDEGLIGADIRKRLERIGYSVPAVARSGEEALFLAQSNAFDLVLMDIRLAGALDGIATAHALKARHEIAVVYITAHADGETIRRARLTEPFGYVLKPIADGDLRSAVEIAIYKHETERRLRVSEAWLSAILHSIGEGVVATNPAGEIVFLNPAAEALTGWAEKEAQGLLLMDILRLREPSEDRPAKNPVFDLRAGETRNYRLVPKTAAPIPVEVASFENRSGDELLGAIVALRDISARREMEERLIQAQRLEAAANLAGAVAHDLNNQLTTILGYAKLLEEHPGGADRESAAEIQSAACAAGSLAHHLTTLSRSERGHPEPLEWNALVGGMQPLIAHAIGRRAALTAGYPAGFVLADPAQMQQMLLLLAECAGKAMPTGSELTIATSCLEIEPSSAEGRLYPCGPYVRTEIRFPADSAEERCREPLEVLLAESIVEQNGGYSRWVAGADRARQFEMLLPCIGAFHRTPEEEDSSRPVTVFLAEEEDSVRRMVCGSLLRSGYAVLEARRSAEAEALASRWGGAIDLLIAGAERLGHPAADLARRLRQQWPELRALFLTGYRHDAAQPDCGDGNAQLPKPFVAQELLRQVRTLLATAPLIK